MKSIILLVALGAILGADAKKDGDDGPVKHGHGGKDHLPPQLENDLKHILEHAKKLKINGHDNDIQEVIKHIKEHCKKHNVDVPPHVVEAILHFKAHILEGLFLHHFLEALKHGKHGQKFEDLPPHVQQAIKHIKEHAHKFHPGAIPPAHIQEAIKHIKEHCHKHNITLPPHAIEAIKKFMHHGPPSPEQFLKDVHEAVEHHHKHKGGEVPAHVKEAFHHLKEEARKHKDHPPHFRPDVTPSPHVVQAIKHIKEHIHKHNITLPPHIQHAINFFHHGPPSYEEFQKHFSQAVKHGKVGPPELREALKYFFENGYNIYEHPPPEKVVHSIRQYGPDFPMFPLIALATAVQSFHDHYNLSVKHFGVNDSETKKQQLADKMCMPVPFLDKALEAAFNASRFPNSHILKHGIVLPELQDAIKYFKQKGYNVYEHAPSESVIKSIREYGPKCRMFPLIALATAVKSFHEHYNVSVRGNVGVKEVETKRQQLADKMCLPVPFLDKALEAAYYAIHPGHHGHPGPHEDGKPNPKPGKRMAF